MWISSSHTLPPDKMARGWKLVAEEGGGGSIYGGLADHAILVFWVAVLLTFSTITTLIFSCADGASKHNSQPDNQASGGGAGCGGGCGG
ncbi:hypothetical protein LXL04_021330 [Taraxacum kok-saghyz]